jgi:pimeloyl-ACP methyl ester carboxylesterase
VEEARDASVIRTQFTLEPRDGDTIRGDVRIPEGPPPRSAIAVIHGFKGFKDWGFFPHVCERLVGAGHAVVSFNLSRNGVGADLESFTELEKFGSNTLSIELDDVMLILDEVTDGKLLTRRPAKVGILGHSRGGGQAILAAAHHESVDSVVTWAAVSHFDRWTDQTKEQWREDGRILILNQRTGQQMPLDVSLLEDYEASRDRLDIPAAASRIRVPWLIVHGLDDLTVPSDEGRALLRASAGARLELVEGAGHTFEARHPFEASTAELNRALQATLKHFGETLEV